MWIYCTSVQKKGDNAKNRRYMTLLETGCKIYTNILKEKLDEQII